MPTWQNTSLIQESIERYRRERDRYVKLADRVADICRELCAANAIRAQVTYRVKSPTSFEGKLRRFARREDKHFPDVNAVFRDISDLAGVRIAAYREEDCAAIVKAVSEAFCGPDGVEVGIDVKDRNKQDPNNFYRAIHAQVHLPEDELIGTYDNLGDVSCEIQICSMMAHVWNEIEHDIGYKSDGSGPGELEMFILKSMGQLVRQGDQAISSLLEAHAKRLGEGNGEFDDLHDFVARVRSEYDVQDFAQNSGQIYDLLVRLNITSPASLKGVIGDFSKAKAQAAIATFNTFIEQLENPTPAMESETSDVLLMQLLETYCEQIIESHKGRVGKGKGAPTRLYRLANRYKAIHAAA
jgi:ppGpp synthetase/RelA/SpoT-type nucleotidyltranferase